METNDKYCPRCNFHMINNNCIRCGYIEINNTDNEKLKASTEEVVTDNEQLKESINNNKVPLILATINLFMAIGIVSLMAGGLAIFSIVAGLAGEGEMLLQIGFIIMVIYIILTLLFFIISSINYFNKNTTKKRKYIVIIALILIFLYFLIF